MVKKKVALVAEIESKLLGAIRLGRAVSRFELAQLFRLAPSTIGIYVDRLLASGYLQEGAALDLQRRGRPMLRLDLRTGAGCFFGVEFSAEKIHGVCLDFSGQVQIRETRTLPRKAMAADALSGLSDVIQAMRARSSLRLLGIGIGVPGTVNPVKGIALDYRFIPDWQNVALAQHLTEEFKVPVALENNARTTALGTLMFDENEKTGDFVSLLVRSGVGAGVVIDGSLQRGHGFTAGEVGRIPAWWGDSNPGHAPTIEEVASIRGITSYVNARISEGAPSKLAPELNSLGIEQVIAAVDDGDGLAREAVQRAASSLGWLAHVVSLVINPKSIILAGPLNALGNWYRLEVQGALHTHAVRSRTNHPAVLLSTLGQDAGALGAASLVMEAWRPDHSMAS